MNIDRLGEFGFIERIRRLIKTDASVVVGPGDDCAVLEYDAKNYLLFSCDMLVEGVDFTLKDSPFLIGRKALCASISDIAACAGIPRYALVSLGINKDLTVKFMDSLMKGILATARGFKVNIVGGDVSRSKQFIIDISILGLVEKKYLVLRSTAKKNDIIFVSGSLGGSIYGRHLRFKPRLKEARFLVKNFKLNSMIDISDGLSQDLNHILQASKVGAIIYEELIPLSPYARSLEEALYMGEDFELIFTLPAKEAKKLMSRKLRIFKPIGEITQERYVLRLIDKKNNSRIINPQGFRHF